MRHRLPSIRYGIVAAFVSALLSAPTLAQPAVQYRVTFPAPEHHYAQVEVTFAGVPARTLEARMSRSSPGRYAVHEFAKNVFDLHAFDGKGRELAPSRPNPSQWDVTGHDGTVRITYKVFGNLVDGTYLAVDESHAHMNMPATFMWARGFDMSPVRMTFVPPDGSTWKPATQLFPTDDPWTFTAPNLQYMMDSPTELSDYVLRAFTVRNADGTQFTIRAAVHSDGDAAAIDEYVAGTQKIVNEAAGVFGEFPAFDTGTYTFLGDYLPWGGGDGMEHRNSTVVAAQTSLRSAGAVQGALGTIAHEFFHCWNVERIRPKTLEPFNFEEANISSELWLAEGFTQYYGSLIMARAGLSPGEQGPGLALNALAIVNAPGRRFHSAVEMSQMAPFTDAAAVIDPTNFSNTFISYYTYGAAIATALDLSLRDRSNGKITLDDYMRAMWLAHGKPGGPQPAIIAKPYTLKDARDRLAEVSGDRAFANEFFDKYIEGRELPDYARLFARAGLILRKSNPGGPWVGLFDQAAALRIPTLVAWGSPAFDAGLEQDDLITTADGKPIASMEEWQAAVRVRKPGDRMVVGYTRRDGQAAQATMTVGEDPNLEVVTVEASGGTLTARQKAFRDAWLGTKRR